MSTRPTCPALPQLPKLPGCRRPCCLKVHAGLTRQGCFMKAPTLGRYMYHGISGRGGSSKHAVAAAAPPAARPARGDRQVTVRTLWGEGVDMEQASCAYWGTVIP